MRYLEAEGYRYVYQDKKFAWKHPATINNDAVDCTDMSDTEFELFVENVELRFGLRQLAMTAEVRVAKAPDTTDEAKELNQALENAWEILNDVV